MGALVLPKPSHMLTASHSSQTGPFLPALLHGLTLKKSLLCNLNVCWSVYPALEHVFRVSQGLSSWVGSSARPVSS